MNFKDYMNNVREEIIAARYKAFSTPSLLPFAKPFENIINYDFNSIGKLVRPTLTVLVTDALGGQHEEGLHLGTAVELTHAGALVVDDIIDEDELRRGKDTVWKRFGNKAAVLYSVLLDVAAASAVRTLNDAKMSLAFREIMEAFARTSYGAMRESNRNPWDWMEYSEVVNGKTATLFRLASRLGCVSAQASSDTMDIMGYYGEQIGIAFQLMDDIIDIHASIKQDTPIGDVKEGKVTLPIMYLKTKYPEFTEELNKYSKGVKYMGDIEHIVEHIDEGIAYTENTIRDTVFYGVNKLSGIPMSNGYKEMFTDYANYVIESMRKEMIL